MSEGVIRNDVLQRTVTAQLQASRFRPSAIRRCVLQTLAEAGGEWQRCEEIFRRITLRKSAPGGLNTVYRILREFEQVGLVGRVRVRSRRGMLSLFRYLAPDGDGEAHTDGSEAGVRLLCSNCGTATEAHDRELYDALLRVAAAALGGSASASDPSAQPCCKFEVRIHGACPSCRDEDRSRTRDKVPPRAQVHAS
jgi:Fe2+ or Zn2+ uptake regulation protein